MTTAAAPPRPNTPVEADVVVIGGGFGGLAAALRLAEDGARVILCERLGYPGGCASTFERKGYRFEAGATLFSGLEPTQLLGGWIRRYHLPVEVEWIDPLVEVRAPGLHLPVPRDRQAFLDHLCALPDAPAAGLRAFFAEQRRVADTLWALLDDPVLLPPFDASTLLIHLRRVPQYTSLLPLLTRPVEAVVRRHGIHGWAPLMAYLGGLCQITVQCGPAEAEAPFALAAMDYYWRGTGHVRGGIGQLATGLCDAIRQAGGEVRFTEQVRGLDHIGGRWRARTRQGVIHSDHVVANLLPGDLGALLGGDAGLERRHTPVAGGWGAVMLYRVVRGLTGPAHHLDLNRDPTVPLVEGNHVFVSIGGPADTRGEREGERVLTASTHVGLDRLRGEDPGRIVADVQAEMRRTITALAPELDDVVVEMTASPRTFARFTGRREGAVGGVPRRAGLGAYGQLGPVSPAPGLWLVGDSVFPGQSTLATALGGVRVAEALRRRR